MIVSDRISSPAMALLVVVACTFAMPAGATPRCEGRLPWSEISYRQELTLVLLRDRKFDELQRRMDGFLAAYVDNKISDEELFFEFGAFDRWGPFLTPLFQEWMVRHPKSFAAHHGMALHTTAVAWSMRGPELSRNTSAEKMDGFHQRLRAARDLSVKSIALHPKPLLAYQLQMMIAKPMRLEEDSPLKILSAALLGNTPSSLEPRPDVLPLLKQSFRVQPDNTIVREAYVSVLAPRWGGTLDALQAYSRPSSHPGLSVDRLASISFAATMEIAADFWFRKQLDDAARIYDIAARICRRNQPLVHIAEIRIEQQRFDEALASADAAIALVPGNGGGDMLRVRALRGLGRHAEAVRGLQKLAPEGIAEVSYLLGEYHATGEGGITRDLAEARRLFELAARAGDERALKKLEAMRPQK